MKTKLDIKFVTIFFSINILVYFTGCKKFLEVGAPTTSLNAENVYQYDNTATAVITGIYTQMMNNDFTFGGITSISLLSELYADNLVLFNLNRAEYLSYYRNILEPNYSTTTIFGNGNYFSNLYPRIYTINTALEGLNKSQTLTSSVKQRLLGEAYFLRAFYYFYLVNLFGDVPLVLTSDYTKNSTINRSSTTLVYQQIVDDLQQAKKMLDDNYVDASLSKIIPDRLRPNLSAAIALLARVELYRKNYSAAEIASTEVINKTYIYSILSTNQVFLKNSKETIWALQPVKTGYNTDEGAFFLLPTAPGNGFKIFYLSQSFINSFENNDNRKTNWVGNITAGANTYPYATKYKADANSTSVSEFNIVLRLSEQYLIRAEARAEQNNITGSQADLNTIRQRAGLPQTTASNTIELRAAILQERRIELFTEWGHRWFDLKRSGTLDDVMAKESISKGGTWASYKALFPIPNAEIQLDENLIQNPGYVN